MNKEEKQVKDNMKRQKRVAVINDITGFGRCSIAAALPIISAMKIQCCPLPTAILSAHTGFENYFLRDFTKDMKPYMEHWKSQKLEFDGIATGFLGSKEQIEEVIHFFDLFKTKDNLVLVDPVMGDYGKLYSSYTEEMCEEMKKLVPYADILTPNLTEACRLLDIPYETADTSEEGLHQICERLSEMGPDKIVITGLQGDEIITNYVYEKGKETRKVLVDKIGKDRSGTGDVFSSVLFGDVINGKEFYDAASHAAEFITKVIRYTVKLHTPEHYGLCFERYLYELGQES